MINMNRKTIIKEKVDEIYELYTLFLEEEIHENKIA